MKLLVGKVKRASFNKRGEMLMEAIVSILLLSILLVIITTMIQTSRNMTARSMDEAALLQEMLLNPTTLASDNLDDFGDIDVREMDFIEGAITFQIPGGTISSTHDIQIYDNNGMIIAFIPDP